MAGIGFSLRRLFQKNGLTALCTAYGYAGIICAGPMILGTLLLIGVSLLADFAGMPRDDRELLNSMITYSLLVSLFVTSWFNMVITRYTSDMLYEEKNDLILPSFYGSCSIMLVMGGISYGVFLCFAGIPLSYAIVCFWFAMIMIVVWTQMVYLTALKDYKSIVRAFAISLLVGFMLALVLVLLHRTSIVSLMLCVIAAYGIMMVWYLKLMLDYFPKSRGSNFRFLRWFHRYHLLILVGGFNNIGLFAHLIIMYFGPLQQQVQGLFYSAPAYDIPALCAYLSTLVSTINFVASVEVRFYPYYKNYYSLFNDKGTIRDIEQGEKEMVTVLKQELVQNGQKQLFATVMFVVFGSILLQILPLGLSDLAIGIYRFLCAGYGLYAIGNSTMLILLYLEDYKGALVGIMAFATVNITGTIIQILFSQTKYFGLGFLAGAVVYFLVVWFRMLWYTRHLPYFLLSRQAFTSSIETGILVSLCDRLEDRYEDKYEDRYEDRGGEHGIYQKG